MAMAVCITNTCLALGGAAAVASDSRAAILLVVPAAAVVLAYRAYMAERRKHESLEFLHEVTRLLARAPDIAAGLAGLLQRTLDVFRGDVAEIILLPSDQRSEPLRTTLEQGATVQAMAPADRYVADASCSSAPWPTRSSTPRWRAAGCSARWWPRCPARRGSSGPSSSGTAACPGASTTMT
jgi:hypothetical protein